MKRVVKHEVSNGALVLCVNHGNCPTPPIPLPFDYLLHPYQTGRGPRAQAWAPLSLRGWPLPTGTEGLPGGSLRAGPRPLSWSRSAGTGRLCPGSLTIPGPPSAYTGWWSWGRAQARRQATGMGHLWWHTYSGEGRGRGRGSLWVPSGELRPLLHPQESCGELLRGHPPGGVRLPGLHR